MLQARDSEWLEYERRRLMGWPLEKLVAWLRWNDPNGSYTDEDSESEGMEPIDVADAVEIIMRHVEENLETPEEMMKFSRAGSNPGGMPFAWDAAGHMGRTRGS